ncbi:TPA: hypothetical protein NJ968_000634 [Vibrio parahaemolyticus]|nr:hypothetical protein [Vibrio parahaemolyticus]HCG8049897.1 hypothetical protein [Vibrio parahaemolyticus]HCG8065307.1 hypothetical protein [Vibrio parahaemolyticus]HCH0774094.1 hypothetical protein [Vibrio parahaemolyticus]
MHDVAYTISDKIKCTPVGEKVVIHFKGLPRSVDIEMVFTGGWIVTQTLVPGNPLVFTRGEDQYLETINITINEYEGLSQTSSS